MAHLQPPGITGPPLTASSGDVGTPPVVQPVDPSCANGGEVTYSYGGDGGDAFDPVRVDGAGATLQLRSGNSVDAIIINGTRRGGEGGSLGDELTLASGEYVTQVVVREGGVVDRLEFTTNRGNTISGGGSGGSETTLRNVKVLKIGGRSGNLLDRIELTYCELPAGSALSGQNLPSSASDSEEAAPSNFSATAGDGQVTLGWDAVTDATGYEYQRKSGGEGGETWLDAGATTGMVVSGLANGMEYAFRVRAVTGSGVSRTSGPPTEWHRATPRAAAPEPAQVDECVSEVGAGGTAAGDWSDDCDSEGREGSHAAYHTFTLTESAEVTVTADSVVDTYLLLRRGAGRDGSVVAENDDHADESDCADEPERDTDSCIVETLAPGAYTIEVTTYDAGQTGEFTLTVDGLPTAASEAAGTHADECVNEVGAGGTAAGSWSDECDSEGRDGSHAAYHTFTLTESAEVTVTADSIVDTYLLLRRGAGRDGSVVAENDDHADESHCAAELERDTDSCIVETLAPGEYTIEVTTYDAGQTGEFTLTVNGLPGVAPEPTPTQQSAAASSASRPAAPGFIPAFAPEIERIVAALVSPIP